MSGPLYSSTEKPVRDGHVVQRWKCTRMFTMQLSAELELLQEDNDVTLARAEDSSYFGGI